MIPDQKVISLISIYVAMFYFGVMLIANGSVLRFMMVHGHS
jgi:hypothetical protein